MVEKDLPLFGMQPVFTIRLCGAVDDQGWFLLALVPLGAGNIHNIPVVISCLVSLGPVLVFGATLPTPKAHNSLHHMAVAQKTGTKMEPW